ncbi:uncharacterized protein G2W53_042087 [Senna tora]|uniref:Uncharacterized protein n=1 Tax=Senna tora TaxID=362788 RepID=A0A834SGR6_9FABA|nr:uncharacterized protein G2W53_042087 [Senna tora]
MVRIEASGSSTKWLRLFPVMNSYLLTVATSFDDVSSSSCSSRIIALSVVPSSAISEHSNLGSGSSKSKLSEINSVSAEKLA